MSMFTSWMTSPSGLSLRSLFAPLLLHSSFHSFSLLRCSASRSLMSAMMRLTGCVMHSFPEPVGAQRMDMSVASCSTLSM